MLNQDRARRMAGSILLATGLVIVLAVAGYWGWTGVQAAQLRAQLQQAPVPAGMPVAVPAGPTDTATPRPTATSSPPPLSPNALLPTHTLLPTATRAATAPPAEPATPVAQPTTLQPTATAPAPPPSATPAPASAAPARLVIPDLRIDTPVVPMGWEVIQTASGPRSEWVIPENEAGHHVNSALLGQQGNLVISGHNNIYGEVLKPISFAWDDAQRIKVADVTDRSEILNGRQIQLFDAAGKVYTYVITEFYRLKDTGVSTQQRIDNGRFMLPTDDTRLTVITCWPPTNNTHRLVVIALPVQ